MKAFIFLILFSLSAQAQPKDAPAELKMLLNQLENSYSFDRWHDNKEKLETLGFEIWQNNRSDKDFCASIQSFPTNYLSTLIAWDKHSPSVCSEEINFQFMAMRLEQLESFELSNTFLDLPGLEPCTDEKPNRPTLGPTEKVNLDTTGGPRLVRGDLKKCEIAFTFDDGPHPQYTLELLSILKEQNVLANFFTVGRNVDRYPDITRATANAGHVVGNHSYSHKNFPKIPYNNAISEIIGGFKSLLKLWDFTTPFFRFPYGAITKKTRAYNQKHDIAEFFWNMDTRDWGIKDPAALYRKVLTEIDREQRGILLFHDVHPQTIDVMPRVLIALRNAGYRPVVFIPEDLIEGDFPK